MSDVYTLPQKKYAFVQEIGGHPHLGAWPSVVVSCILDKTIRNFGTQLAVGQEKLIRELAKERGIKLP